MSPPTLALAFVFHAACTGVCKGPGCEEAYPTSRLSVVRGVVPGEVELSAAALGQWSGTEDEGANWTAAFAGSSVVLGQPDPGRVVLLDDRVDIGAVDPVTQWVDAAGELGASLVVVPAPDDPEEFDLWIGAPGTSQSRGAVHLLRDAHLAESSTSFTGDLVITSATPSDRFGSQLVPCADLNGDRVPDLAIPVPQLSEPPGWQAGMAPLAGAVFFVLSSQPPELGVEEIWTSGRVYWGETAGEGAGTAVSCDRDLDLDGTIDVVIGAPWHDGTRGRVYVLEGVDAPSGPLVEAAARIIEGPTPREWFGTSLVTLDIGQPLLVVGSPGHADGSGRVHVYPGRELDGLGVPRPTAVIVQDLAHEYGDHFGRTLARGRVVGGEADGLPVPDPVPDLIVGAPDYRAGSNGYDTGRLWIWSGADSARWGPDLTTETADAVIVGSHPFQRVGRAPRLGDPDRDGVDDLLVPTRAPRPR